MEADECKAVNGSVYYQNTCYNQTEAAELNITELAKNKTDRSPPAEDFFEWVVDTCRVFWSSACSVLVRKLVSLIVRFTTPLLISQAVLVDTWQYIYAVMLYLLRL